VITDREQYEQEMLDYSPQSRFARYAKEKGITLVTVMVATMVDEVQRQTVIKRDDLVFAANTFQKVARAHDSGYLNYLTDPELGAAMYHYDNLTASGQRLFGAKLTRDLRPLLAARTARVE
jgi:hypothetical protein